MNSEDRLEAWLEADISILSDELLLIGRQVTTAHGGRIDLLAINAEGALSIIELKRDRTPRDIVAQILDYASWVRRLDTPMVYDIANAYWLAKSRNFVDEFQRKFDRFPPEPLNSSHSMIVVASALDPASQRIVEYLSQEHDVGINTAFFTIFSDGERQYLSADWLMDQDEVVERTERKVRAPWTGFKYVNAGESEHRSWADMRRLGFVAAGHGPRWSRQLIERLSPGDVIYVYQKGAGYVGHGRVVGEAVMAKDLRVGGMPLLEHELVQPGLGHDRDDAQLAEYVVPVEWLSTCGVAEAKTFPGAFASQHVVCRLSDPTTLSFLEKAFA
ncbi:MAG: hypothetical protein QM676_08910 [Novosphingobium sp.]